MSSNLPLIRRSHRVRGGHKLEINIPQQQIHAKSKGGLINEGGVMLSEYGTLFQVTFPYQFMNLDSSHGSYIQSC